MLMLWGGLILSLASDFHQFALNQPRLQGVGIGLIRELVSHFFLSGDEITHRIGGGGRAS